MIKKGLKDITKWDNKECSNHMAAYAGTTPPLIPDDLDECNGLRFEQSRLLKKLGMKYGKRNWIEAGMLFEKSGELIVELVENALRYNSNKCSELLIRIADLEEEAYKIISVT